MPDRGSVALTVRVWYLCCGLACLPSPFILGKMTKTVLQIIHILFFSKKICRPIFLIFKKNTYLFLGSTFLVRIVWSSTNVKKSSSVFVLPSV